MKLRHREVKELTQGHIAGNDLEALQLHLCILASDFTIEGRPSLEVPLINVTRKPLPQQTKGKEKTYNNKCQFLKHKNLFSGNIKRFGNFLHSEEALLVNGFGRQALSKFCRGLLFLFKDLV